MHKRMARLGLAGATAVAATVALAVPPAMADYAPNSHDVVGVGSDTLQYAGDFVADGSYTGSAGFNTGLNKYKIINFDATPDANARLAYGPNGVGTGSCAPGTGGTQGTGGSTATHADKPCTLNPSIVLRAGTKPVQRPNGSGAGAKAFAGDTTSGRDWLTYSRASSSQDSTLPSTTYDVMEIGHDPLAMLTATTTNAIPLSATQLGQIYTCNKTNWTQFDNTPQATGDSTHTYATYYYTQADVTAGFAPSAGDVQLTSGTIIPIVPQVGSGTRSSFESAIGVTDAQILSAACVQVSEENDPTAISAQSSPANAIEPLSGGRLNMFLGLSGSTGSSLNKGGYFQDPSCPIVAAGTPSGTGDCTAGTDGTSARVTGAPIVRAVTLVTTGNPSDDQTACTGNGCTFTGSSVLDISRPLYVYFRKADVDSATPWLPGTTLNPIRTLFYNPCDDAVSGGVGHPNCLTISGVEYGPGGQPYYAKSAGQTDIAAAGINPTYAVSETGTSGLPG